MSVIDWEPFELESDVSSIPSGEAKKWLPGGLRKLQLLDVLEVKEELGSDRSSIGEDV